MVYPYIQPPQWYIELYKSVPQPPKRPTKPNNTLVTELEIKNPPFKIPHPEVSGFAGVPRLLFCIVVLIFSIKYALVAVIIGCCIGLFVSIVEILKKSELEKEYTKLLTASKI